MTTAGDAPPKTAPAAVDDPRRRKLLDAATAVFIRFGFRKTSMDEVARAAAVSRQGLYLHFATKEDLFRAAVAQLLEASLKGARGCLNNSELPLEKRLSGAFDEWMGRFIGTMGPGAADLAEASDALVGPLVAEQQQLFTEAIAKALRTSGLAAAYKPTGLTARQLADTLNATARGLKHQCAARPEFVERFSYAVRALCLPLRPID